MAKVQLLRRRIRSVKNIRQITKAMEMVAASKLRRAQEATLRTRPYATSAREALAQLRLKTDAALHPLLAQREVKTRLLIVFTSDRGLAGAYNSNVLKGVLETLSQQALPTKLIIIGQKGNQFISKLRGEIEVVGAYTNFPTAPTAADIRSIAASAIEAFTQGQVDRVEVLFTDYVSSLKQVVVRRQVLPVDPQDILESQSASTANTDEYIFEPAASEVLAYVVPRFVEIQIFQACLEAIASEQSMRMLAMKNASDNAKNIMSDLTLTYNGVRQAVITQELAEITSGAEALS